LRKDVNAAEVRIHAVGKRDVDDSIDTAKGDRRLGTIAGERIEAFPGSPRQKHSQGIFNVVPL
jgi:hypothetical protein